MLRLTAIGVACFQHEGLRVDARWTTFDYAAAPPGAQLAFRTYVGTFIKVHPEDRDKLTRLGLALEGGRIVEVMREVPTELADKRDAAIGPGTDPRTRARPR